MIGKKRGRQQGRDDWSDDDSDAKHKSGEQERMDRIRRRAMAMDGSSSDDDDESSSEESEAESGNDNTKVNVNVPDNKSSSEEDSESEDDSEDDSESEDDSDSEGEELDPEAAKLAELRESIRQLSFGQLQKLRKTGIDGKPVHKALGFQSVADLNAWIAGDDSVLASGSGSSMGNNVHDKREKRPSKEPRTKRHKSAPFEMPSNKQVRRYREIIQVPNKASRDPRFESLSGHLNPDSFKKSYAFLSEMRNEEIEKLSKALDRNRTMRAKGKKRFTGKLSQEEASRMQVELTQLQQQRAKEIRENELQGLKSARMKDEKAKVAAGTKKPFYLKKSAVKRMELEHKYKKLKETGKLNKYLEKRRKKNAAKDHRFVPSERRIDDE